jgi:hypothetical protein
MKVFQDKECWFIEDYLDDSIIEEIRTIIQENLNNLYKNKEGYSTTGKNAEQYWLIHQKDDFFVQDSRFYDFEKKYKNQILNRIKAADLFDERNKEDIDLKHINAWSVIGEENSYHTIHCHNEGIFDGISTLVYLEVPETNVKDEPENDIFLVTRVGSGNPFYYKIPPYSSINPEVGKLLIFPDWVLHGTYPQTKGIRQTFNIDYRLILKQKNKTTKLSYN